MKRFVFFTLTLCSCTLFLAGCAADTHEGLIDETLALLKLAGGEVGNITTRVNEAVKNYEKNPTENKLDLSDAIKTAEQLKKHGEKAQEIKQRIEKVRGLLTEDQKRQNAENHQGKLNQVVKDLLEAQTKLRLALDAAEKISKTEVDRLRKKLTEAESPFESLGRPQQ